MLKLVSLPVASAASLHLTLGDASRLALTPHQQWGYALSVPEGGRNRERNRRIPRTSPPYVFVLRLRLQKGHNGNNNHDAYQ